MDIDSEAVESASPSQDQADRRPRSRHVHQEIDITNSNSSSSCSIISDSQKDHDEILLEEENDEKVESRDLPSINVPEKIVLCVDTSEDLNHTPFKLGDGTKYPPLYMIKRVAEIFMYLKNTINKNHEFALVVLHDNTVNWVRNFTNDPRLIVNELEKLSPTAQGEVFNLTSLFDVLRNNIPLPPTPMNPTTNVPPFVPRVILLYGRSHCIPQFLSGRDSFDFLNRCIYFTLDIIYVHEDPLEENKCEEIFLVLNELDHDGFSYMFNVLRNATKLHDHMAKLLAHPLQRPLQKQAAYKL